MSCFKHCLIKSRYVVTTVLHWAVHFKWCVTLVLVQIILHVWFTAVVSNHSFNVIPQHKSNTLSHFRDCAKTSLQLFLFMAVHNLHTLLPLNAGNGILENLHFQFIYLFWNNCLQCLSSDQHYLKPSVGSLGMWIISVDTPVCIVLSLQCGYQAKMGLKASTPPWKWNVANKIFHHSIIGVVWETLWYQFGRSHKWLLFYLNMTALKIKT